MRHYSIRVFQRRILLAFDTVWMRSGIISIGIFAYAPGFTGSVRAVRRDIYFLIRLAHIGEGVSFASATAAARASGFVKAQKEYIQIREDIEEFLLSAQSDLSFVGRIDFWL